MATQSSHNEFIAKLYPAAVQASKETGMSWELMLAQAALETGWGQKVLPGTNNIFNIKAGKGWQGESKTFHVWEIKNGKKIWIDDSFRVYKDYTEAFTDRTNFLQKNPRYAKAGLFDEGVKGDMLAEAKALQAAGYATDPNYAKQLAEIFNGRTMQNALAYARSQNPDLAESSPSISSKAHTETTTSKPNIQQWQSDLNHLGYKGTNGKPLAVDGVIGPQTKSAIEAFQKDHGLAVDGVVGPKTLKALEEAKVKQQAAPESKKADVSAEQASASPVRNDARLVQLGEQILQRLDDIYRAVSTQKPQFNVQQNLNVAAYWLGRAVKEQFPLNQPCSCVSFETRNNKELMHTFFNQGGVQAAVTADVNKGADTPVEQSLAAMQQSSVDQAQEQNVLLRHK